MEVGNEEYGLPDTVSVDGKNYDVRHMRGEWFELAWREAEGETQPANADGRNCRSTGPHLHQRADVAGGTILWRNADRTDELDDDGMGFDHVPLTLIGRNIRHVFCSDNWLFKMLPVGEGPPETTPVQRCDAPRSAPGNIQATERNGQIDLTWEAPLGETIDRYEVRKRLSSATTADANPWGDGWETISEADSANRTHTITGLTNGTGYTIQVRAKNTRGVGPPATVSGTPSATSQPAASLTISAVAGDDLPGAWVNKAEQAAGFAISGSSEAGASVTVTVGATALSAVTAGSMGAWTVSVPAAASYVGDGQFTISATATRTGFSDGSASATVTVDTVPPSVSYTPPTSLTVGTAVTISPTTTDTDIALYALKSDSTLPSGLSLNATSGVISGTPSAATAARTVTIVVTDRAGNTSDVTLSLPAVTAGTDPPPPTVTPPPPMPQCTLTVNPSPSAAASAVTTTHDCGETVTPTHPSANACWDESGTLAAVTLPGTAGNTDVTANYTEDTNSYTLTVEPSPARAASAGTSTHNCGDMLTPTHPSPANHCWTASGSLSKLTITADTTVTASFSHSGTSYTLTPGVGPDGGGSVGGGGMASCGDPPPAVTATPNTCRQLDRWEGDTTGIMLADRTVTAHFEHDGTHYTLRTSVSPAGFGTVSGGGSHPCGDKVTVTATPAASAIYFTGWSGDCSGISLSCDVTMTGPKSVTATFATDCDPETGVGCRRVNAGEQQAGFTFKVNPGGSAAGGAGARTETPLTVEVTIGDSDPLEVSPVEGEAGTWLVQVPANASFLTEGAHDVVVEWRRGKELVASATTTILVDLTAPSVSYTAPASLSVGTAVSISPTTADTDIDSYALKAGSSLPAGLTLDGTSGVVSGTPSAAAAAGDVTIVVTDDAGNTREVTLALPAVTE